MKISDLLAQAAACTDQASLDALMAMLQTAFHNKTGLKGLQLMNPDASLNDGNTFVSFELSRLISAHYATTVTVQIRDKALTVDVRTNHLLDGLGFGSQSWKECEGFDDGYWSERSDSDRDTDKMAEQAVKVAIQHHAELIEQVGVPYGQASATALACW